MCRYRSCLCSAGIVAHALSYLFVDLFAADGLIRVIHAKGVNVRKLGVLRSQLVEGTPIEKLILSEMLARVIKNHLRFIMRNKRGGM